MNIPLEMPGLSAFLETFLALGAAAADMVMLKIFSQMNDKKTINTPKLFINNNSSGEIVTRTHFMNFHLKSAREDLEIFQ